MVSIRACHARDRGSIPREGDFLFFWGDPKPPIFKIGKIQILFW